MIFGPVVDTDPTEDLDFADIEGNNIRKQNDVVTLDYSEVEFIKQNFATRTESVTPFLISFWNGTIELNPASDNWVDTTRLDAKIIETEGNYSETFRDMVDAGTIDPQTGFGPMLWDSWETNWTGIEVVDATRERVIHNLELQESLVLVLDLESGLLSLSNLIWNLLEIELLVEILSHT